MLLVTAPFVVQWAWYTMAELPVLAMVLLFAVSLARYLEAPSKRSLLPAAVLLALAMWTKQTAGFAAVWAALVVLAHAERGLILRRRDTWIAAAVATLLIAPLVAITLWLGDKHLAQTLGSGASAGSSVKEFSLDLPVYLRYLWRGQLHPVVVLLAALGIVGMLVTRQKHSVFLLLWLLTVLVIFSQLTAKVPRYTIFWLPPLILCAVWPLMALRQSPVGAWSARVLLAFLVSVQIWQVYAKPVSSASGYAEAAQFVLARSGSPSIFFDGYNNGYFTWFVRREDEERRFRVLRGDKLLSSSAIMAQSRLTEHARCLEDIIRILDEQGVEYLIVERDPTPDISIHRTLRELLESDRFELVKEIPIEAVRRPPLTGQTLLVYRYLDAKLVRSGSMILHLPTVGKIISVPVVPKE